MIAPAQQVSHGQLKSFPKFSSEHIGERTIAVWLPENYTSEQSYPTLYMHDGQMLFDAKTTWNGQEWGIDEVAHRLIQQGDVPPFIVVGIWNAGPLRHSEYFPQKPFELLKESARDSILEYSKRGKEALFKKPIQSDAYLKFLTQELKPFIDKNFATRPGPENTFLMGSSMGGLISWYALCEYPDIFGGAACMSTHWPGGFVYEDNPIPDSFIDYLDKNLPPPAKHRLYFDLGDATLDANYPPLQQKVDLLMTKKGYSSTLWTTRFFPGENHSEEAWNKRLHEPLIFLFNPKK
ncbi:MAG: alpha/beta hydrolase [Flavobacteriaceae bacterium]